MVLLQDSPALIKHRVLYIGSAVPLETKSGLDAIQKPLLERYPVDESNIQGIDTSLTVTNTDITMQYIDTNATVVQFPISSLTMCAAVRCVNTINAATEESQPKFVSLNDPLSGGANSTRPALFTMITRRTKGRRVLECHGYICSSARDAMELVKCTQRAGEHYKRTQHMQENIPDNRSSAGPFQTLNQTSTISRSMVNGAPNGLDREPEMRLIPGEPIAHVKTGPEFYEPVSKQGYFYSSNQAEVKKYNVHKLNNANNANKENIEVEPTPRELNGHGPTVIRVGAAPPIPPQYFMGRPPRMQYFPPQHPHHMTRPMYYGPPPPQPPPPIYVRPRFFSPPPPSARPMPYMMQPPEPVFAPPIYVRRPRSGGSRSGSRSSSRGSRSNSPRQTENTTPKVVPNGDADTSSEGTLTKRPDTPPTDYGKNSKGQRMSRRDDYEYRYRQQSPSRYHPRDNVPPPFMYDYYVQPPLHGGYEPFMMYNPHARSRSMPPRGRSSSPHKKGKKKKQKKLKKKSKHSAPAKKPEYGYGRYAYAPRPTSDVSTDSHAGYHSEIPARTRNPLDTDDGVQFYPPRDFRRNENQFINERNFSKSILEETRRSRDSKSYPTAYEMNERLAKSTPRDPDVDFNMY